MVKIEDALFRGFHLDMVLLNFAATLMSKLTDLCTDVPFLTHFCTIGVILLEHLLVQTNTVGALCFDTIRIGILVIMKDMMRIFEIFAVVQLICVKFSTLVDHQMTAADTDLQDGVSMRSFTYLDSIAVIDV